MSKQRRRGVSASMREQVLEKTNGHCHVCGKKLDSNSKKSWHVDHVIPHAKGGNNDLGNYLPVCKGCNRMRWNYSPQQIRWVMRVGIFAKHEIRHQTAIGKQIIDMVRSRLKTNKSTRVDRLNANELSSMQKAFAKKSKGKPKKR